jgi:DNA-binding transcriptional MerR regulator
MPFKSESQRKLFFAALKSAKLRKRLGVSLAEVKKMLEHDEGGKLPAVSEGTRDAVKRRRR